jgi:hypothetical protein
MSRIRRVVPVALALAATLAVSQTALGFKQTSTTGTVGAHSYSDTQSAPGIICIYTEGTEVAKLKRIDVKPPDMYGVPGAGTQWVGWQYKVQRQITGFSGPGPWKTTYTSDIFKTQTDGNPNHRAAFGSDSVKVHVPYEYGADASATYRVKSKLFWYRNNSSTDITGTASGRYQWYVAYVGLDSIKHKGMCNDYEA